MVSYTPARYFGCPVKSLASASTMALLATRPLEPQSYEPSEVW